MSVAKSFNKTAKFSKRLINKLFKYHKEIITEQAYLLMKDFTEGSCFLLVKLSATSW